MPRVSEDYIEEKKNHIIDAAYNVALRKSISSMTLLDVTKEAGMARGAVYRYFSSLDEILAALVIRVNRDNSYEDEIEKIFDGSADNKPSMVIRALIDFFYEYLLSREMDVNIISMQFDLFLIHDPKRVMAIISNIGDSANSSSAVLIQSISGFIEKGKSTGNIHTDLKTESLVEYFITIYKGIMLQYSLSKSAGEVPGYDVKASFDAMYMTIVSLLGCE